MLTQNGLLNEIFKKSVTVNFIGEYTGKKNAGNSFQAGYKHNS